MKNRYKKEIRYNRQTKAYRINVSKGKLKEMNIKSPEEKHTREIMKVSVVLFIIWIVATLFVAIKIGFIGMVGCFLLAIAYVCILSAYFRKYQRELITAYMDLNISKEIYLSEMSKRNKDNKAMKKLEKEWDIVKRKRERKNGKKNQ